MSGDTPVARVEDRIVIPINPERAPLCFQGSGDLPDWLGHRAIDRYRPNARMMKRALSVDTLDDAGTAMLVRGAAVTDDYWIRAEHEDIGWDQVRFGTDRLAATALYGQTDGIAPDMIGVPSPELTNTGSFEKCWKRSDRGWIMIKAGTPEQNFAERLAYLLNAAMGLATAAYYPAGGCTASPDFTGGRFNLEPMRYLVQDDADCARSCSVLRSLGEDLARQYLDILFMDALIENPDRHAENYGVLRDRETGRIVSLTPNFDNNMALIGHEAERRANPLIPEFRELLSGLEIKYARPRLPSGPELADLIREAAGNTGIPCDAVYGRLQSNYERIVY